jgi:hypothetical protein
MQEIRIRCDVKDHLPLGSFVNLQGNLKSLSTENYQKLRKHILELGFTAPIFVWNNKILDGHQRLKTVQQMVSDRELSCSHLPIVNINAENEDEARRMLSGFVSQFGRVDEQGLYEFATESNWSPAFMLENMDIPGFDMPKFLEGYYDNFKIPGEENESDESMYSKKIEAPIYEPKGEKPQLNELVDYSKMTELISQIDAADISEDEKHFLKAAAYRHNVFNYEKIAEYYAHSSTETKDLMEKSALVIIDFNKAIENGFVQMSTVIADMFSEEFNTVEDVDE